MLMCSRFLFQFQIDGFECNSKSMLSSSQQVWQTRGFDILCYRLYAVWLIRSSDLGEAMHEGCLGCQVDKPLNDA